MTRILIAGVISAMIAPAAQADPWEEFTAVCLDAYEALNFPVVGEFREIVPDQPIEGFSADAKVFGPTDSGAVVVSDPAPEEGRRACALIGGGDAFDAFRAWRDEQLANGRYELDADGESLISVDWVEPRLRVSAHLNGTEPEFIILETDLEG